jgi:hypothetical protein
MKKEQLFADIKEKYNVNPKEILFTVPILHIGWETDNDGWIVLLEDNTIASYTTDHGSLCEWIREEFIDKTIETKNSLEMLLKVAKYIV